MKEIIVYTMSFKGEVNAIESSISCVSFKQEYWIEYKKIYNDCFYEMRKYLEIEPINFYSNFSQMKDKEKSTYVYLENGIIIGAVTCVENEIDDLIVNPLCRRNGVGQKLLHWGMKHIKEQGYNEIILHVAEWNKNATSLYLKTGFTLISKEKIR